MFFRAAVRKRLQTSTKIVSSGVQILVSKCSRISFCLYPSRNILMKKPEFSAIDLWHRLRPESSCGDLYFLCATHSQPHGVSQSLVQHLSPLMLALGLRFLIWCRTLESVKCVCVCLPALLNWVKQSRGFPHWTSAPLHILHISLFFF